MIDNEDYLHEFKRDYSCSEGGKYNLQVQVKHLVRQAEFYYKKYQKNDDRTDCLRVSYNKRIKLSEARQKFVSIIKLSSAP